ncbi:hypothetical protein AVEN_165423-1 [Araneus ventricosus]|uniref:Uncharacterized protein n=1 Tax=Araneus ventricosus TaxID=182803 RepID=A0A4Y2AT84_ARAVE|nr:hypothetical protein AVEN_165423-1 [Araneus ventricosus]
MESFKDKYSLKGDEISLATFLIWLYFVHNYDGFSWEAGKAMYQVLGPPLSAAAVNSTHPTQRCSGGGTPFQHCFSPFYTSDIEKKIVKTYNYEIFVVPSRT